MTSLGEKKVEGEIINHMWHLLGCNCINLYPHFSNYDLSVILTTAVAAAYRRYTTFPTTTNATITAVAACDTVIINNCLFDYHQQEACPYHYHHILRLYFNTSIDFKCHIK